jgi:hypothetical protein
MAARDVFISTSKQAESAKIATLIAAETTRQEAVNASAGCNTGYHSGSASSSASYDAAVAAANAAKAASVFNAEVVRQATLMQARDVLRNAGDFGPV